MISPRGADVGRRPHQGKSRSRTEHDRMPDLPISTVDFLLNQTLVDMMPVGVVVLDRFGLVRRYNRYEQELAGRLAQDVLGRHFFEEVAMCTRVPELYGAFEAQLRYNQLDTIVDYVFKLPFLPQPREVRILMRSFQVIEDLFAVLLVEDVSEKRLLQVERDRLLSTLMHDLNQPLTGIVGYAQMMTAGLLESDEIMPAAQVILQSGEQMTSLIRQQQEQLTHGRSVAMRTVNLHAIVLAVLSLYLGQARDKGVELHYEGRMDQVRFPSRAIGVRGDAQFLGRVVSNLVSNAIKYARSRVSLEVTVAAEVVSLIVSDDGAGVPPAERDRIFDYGYQIPGSQAGQGFGLASVAELVQQMQGKIEVGDAAGGGALFRIMLPAAEEVSA
ncbi:MAG: sensor histidine kinase [Candidatus Xenobia bacterium]